MRPEPLAILDPTLSVLLRLDVSGVDHFDRIPSSVRVRLSEEIAVLKGMRHVGAGHRGTSAESKPVRL